MFLIFMPKVFVNLFSVFKEKTPRLLQSSSSAMKHLTRKAELMGINTEVGCHLIFSYKPIVLFVYSDVPAFHHLLIWVRFPSILVAHKYSYYGGNWQEMESASIFISGFCYVLRR